MDEIVAVPTPPAGPSKVTVYALLELLTAHGPKARLWALREVRYYDPLRPRFAFDVLGEKFASPEYCAVMVWDPTVSDDVLNVAATPPLIGNALSCVAPSKNVTVPVGVPEPDTVAVNVTDVPAVDGFSDDVSAVEEGRVVDSG